MSQPHDRHEVLHVGRAWPKAASDGILELRVEGRDAAGQLRAGLLRHPLGPVPAQITTEQAAGAGGALELLPFRRDPKLPDLAEAPGELLVHRAGRRAVLAAEDHYVKVVRPRALDQVVEATRTGADVAARVGWHAPEVLDAEGGTMTMSVVPGTSLHDLGTTSTQTDWARAWNAFADGWAGLALGGADQQPHEDRGSAAGLTPHTAQDEARILTDWAGWATGSGVLPAELTDGLRERARRAVADLLDRPGPTHALAHRDLHDKQLLHGPDGLGILDFDTAATAEVELDLANLLEHLHLRLRQGLWSQDRVAVAEAAVDRVLGECGADDDRLAAYREATRMRLACLYLFRPAQAAMAQEWVRELV